MATLMEIEEAIKSIETKKQSLKQSFDDLQNNSHSLSSSFTLSWPQIDSHFSHIHSSLLSRFSLLQQHHQSSPQFDHQNPNNDQKIQSLPELERTPGDKNPKKGQKKPSLPRFELNKENPDVQNPKNDQNKLSLPELDRTPDVQNPKNDQNKQSLPELDRTPDDENPKKDQKELSLSLLEQNKETPDGQKSENDQNIQSLPELERTQDDENPKIDQKEPSLHNLKQNEEDPDVKNQQKVHVKSICERMEGEKLGKLVKDSSELEEWSVNELSQALKYAPDPYKLVLDATEGNKPRGLVTVILFESLMMIEGVEFSEEMRDRAKGVAIKWKDEVNKEPKSPFDALGLLSLLACFKLVNDFDKDDVVELVYIGSKDARAVNLCRALGLEDIVLGLVQKLINNKKQLSALKFIHEFKLVDRFSSVEILSSYLENSQKIIEKRRKSKKNDPASLIDCDVKEKAVLNTVVKYIKDYKLESKYPPETLKPRIKELEESIDNRKSNNQEKITAVDQHDVPVNHTDKCIEDCKHEPENPPQTQEQHNENVEVRDDRREEAKKMMGPQQYVGPVNYTGFVPTRPQLQYVEPVNYTGFVPTRPLQHHMQPPIKYVERRIGTVDESRDYRRNKKPKKLTSLQQYEVPINYTASVPSDPQQR